VQYVMVCEFVRVSACGRRCGRVCVYRLNQVNGIVTDNVTMCKSAYSHVCIILSSVGSRSVTILQAHVC